jgi:hypothetical protein
VVKNSEIADADYAAYQIGADKAVFRRNRK